MDKQVSQGDMWTSSGKVRECIEQVEVHPLVAMVTELTGDLSLLRSEFRPKVGYMTATVPKDGGLLQETAAQIRDFAADKLWQWQCDGRPSATSQHQQTLEAILSFLIGDEASAYFPLLENEMEEQQKAADPGWRYTEGRHPIRVGIIGAGISGIALAYRLQKVGIQYCMWEKNDEVGGTWWENRYPGCRLDTPNFAYTYRFAREVDWPDLFSRQPEILKYLKTTVDTNGLREHIEVNTKVLRAEWREERKGWKILVEGPEGVREEECTFLISAVGILNQPKYPDIKGRTLYQGTAVHSARWPKHLDLKGKRVAIIGTGASAYQIAPEIAPEVQALTVYQRHAPWMLPTPRYHDPVPEGMKQLMRVIPRYGEWYRFWQFWLSVEGRLYVARVDPAWREEGSVSAANKQFRIELEKYYQQQYTEMPDLLEKVIPTYAPGAKRLLRDNGQWARMLTRSNVTLETREIKEITTTGIVTKDGEDRDYDYIIYATGFRASDMLGSFELIGEDGISLQDIWEGNARSYGGTMIPKMPNFGMLLGPNQAVLINGSIPFMSECAADYVMALLKLMNDEEKDKVVCKEAAYWKFNEEMDEANKLMVWGVSDVPTWYNNQFHRTISTWPKSQLEFWQRTRKVQKDDIELS